MSLTAFYPITDLIGDPESLKRIWRIARDRALRSEKGSGLGVRMGADGG